MLPRANKTRRTNGGRGERRGGEQHHFTFVGRSASRENFEYLLHGGVGRNNLYRILSASVEILNGTEFTDIKR